MQRIIIAPDSFKGTMSAREICDILENEVKKLVPEAGTVKIPMSDGGEGMVEAYLGILGGEKKYLSVTGPKGMPVNAAYGILSDGSAITEMAECAGLSLMEGRLDPLHATTFGVGQLLRHLSDGGVRKVLMGIGGSATNDCGVGMAAALGYVFEDEAGVELAPYACNIGKIRHIRKPEALPELDITVACDVDNPLCGEKGASAIFGPQKGLKKEQIGPLDEDIRSFAALVKAELSVDVLNVPGAGAAGGLGAALMAFCGARLTPGIEMLLDAAGMDRLLTDARLVITGEGRIDHQSASGKVPVGVSRRAKRANVPCIAICGCVGEGAEAVLNEGISAFYACTDGTKSFEEIVKSCRDDLRETAARVLPEYIN